MSRTGYKATSFCFPTFFDTLDRGGEPAPTEAIFALHAGGPLEYANFRFRPLAGVRVKRV